MEYKELIYEKKSWKQIILLVGVILQIISLVFYITINLSTLGVYPHLFLSDHFYTVTAIRVTITGIATILIAIGLLSLRKYQEIQKKKIIASAVVFLLIVPLKMALDMIVYYYLYRPLSSPYWFYYFVVATSLFTDFIPYFISTTIINSIILKIEKKLKRGLMTNTIIFGIALLFSIIITILNALRFSSNLFDVFLASTIVYGVLGIVTTTIYLILIAKWLKKNQHKKLNEKIKFKEDK